MSSREPLDTFIWLSRVEINKRWGKNRELIQGDSVTNKSTMKGEHTNREDSLRSNSVK